MWRRRFSKKSSNNEEKKEATSSTSSSSSNINRPCKRKIKDMFDRFKSDSNIIESG